MIPPGGNGYPYNNTPGGYENQGNNNPYNYFYSDPDVPNEQVDPPLYAFTPEVPVSPPEVPVTGQQIEGTFLPSDLIEQIEPFAFENADNTVIVDDLSAEGSEQIPHDPAPAEDFVLEFENLPELDPEIFPIIRSGFINTTILQTLPRKRMSVDFEAADTKKRRHLEEKNLVKVGDLPGLPEEIWIHIFKYVTEDLPFGKSRWNQMTDVFLTCKDFYRLMHDPLILKTFFADYPIRALGLSAKMAVKLCADHFNSPVCTSANALSLDFTECKELTDEDLILLGQHCKNLVSIKMGSLDETNRCQVTSAGVTSLAQLCPNLRDIRLILPKNVNGADLSQIPQHCRHLESLCIYGCSGTVTNDLFSELGKHCNSLRNLHIITEGQTDDNGINNLMTGCTALQTITLGYCGSFSSPALINMAAILNRNLLELSLIWTGFEFSDMVLGALGVHCMNLKKLVIDNLDAEGLPISDTGVVSLAVSCTQLETLKFGICNQLLTDASLQAIMDNCPQFKEIQCYTANAFSSTMVQQFVQHFSALTHLDICRYLSDEDVLLIAMAQQKLTSLVLDFNDNITDEIFSYLEFWCHDLKTLSIKYCPKITLLALESFRSKNPGIEVIYQK